MVDHVASTTNLILYAILQFKPCDKQKQKNSSFTENLFIIRSLIQLCIFDTNVHMKLIYKICSLKLLLNTDISNTIPNGKCHENMTVMNMVLEIKINLE